MLRKEMFLLRTTVQKPLVSVTVQATCINFEYMVNVSLSSSYPIGSYSASQLFSGVTVKVPADATLHLGFSMKSGYKGAYEIRYYKYTGAINRTPFWDGKSSTYSVYLEVYAKNE